MKPSPITVRGVVVSKETLSARNKPPVVVSADDPETRVLMLARPRMRGSDVEALQRALGFEGATDRAFQQKKGLKVDGKVGPATRSALGLD